jgi:circadian clock protein KaiC
VDGIRLLDDMLGDGYWPGSATLCAGPSGIGKTLMSLHFITSGAALGEPSVIASLQENPSQLELVARSFSWTLDGVIEVLYRSPVDSLADLQFASGDRTRFREYMYSPPSASPAPASACS